jgi:hypothetical protein
VTVSSDRPNFSGWLGSNPSCRWLVKVLNLGIFTTSRLSRLNSENTASMPPPLIAMSRWNGVVAVMVAQTLCVSTSRSAPSASP